MTTARDRFLQAVRRAVAEGNRAGHVPTYPERGKVGYQGAGPEALTRFGEELTAAGGHLHVVQDREAAAAKVIELVKASSARQVLLGRGAVLDSLQLTQHLRNAGVAALTESNRQAFFQADIGVTGVDYLIAETGSLILFTRAEQPRSSSLLPPVHIAVAERSQLIHDLFDLFNLQEERDGQGLPACVTIITGPSKTGDIELKLVTGVHGPGVVHVVVIGANGFADPITKPPAAKSTNLTP
jgi:L-lactate dehydrogenase complex protein LldG